MSHTWFKIAHLWKLTHPKRIQYPSVDYIYSRKRVYPDSATILTYQICARINAAEVVQCVLTSAIAP